jgi:hypothetical protein
MLISVKEIHVLIPVVGDSLVFNCLIDELKALTAYGELDPIPERHDSVGIVYCRVYFSSRVRFFTFPQPFPDPTSLANRAQQIPGSSGKKPDCLDKIGFATSIQTNEHVEWPQFYRWGFGTVRE